MKNFFNSATFLTYQRFQTSIQPFKCFPPKNRRAGNPTQPFKGFKPLKGFWRRETFERFKGSASFKPSQGWIIRVVFILLTQVAFSQTTYVPDDNFEQALIDLGYDDTLDDYVLTANISGVTSLDVNDKSISDLTGIEAFTDLTNLECQDNQLTNLDVSANTALTYLHCAENQLTSLDVSNNTALDYLDCINNQLTTLDVSANTALTNFYCINNQLTTLDVSNNTALTAFNCSSNQLTTLELSNNTALTNLGCYSNQLTSLDVSSNTALSNLECGDNQLTSLDVSSNTALTNLGCGDNQLTSLDVSSNTALTSMDCGSNQLTSLDVSSNTALTILQCYNNQLTSLDVSNNTALTYLEAQNNSLTSLDVSSNTVLTGMDCGSNSLTSLDVSANTALTNLRCLYNQLSTLDVSSNTALEYLTCQGNQFTSLNLSTNTALVQLFCGHNQLTQLDLSNNPILNRLYCYSNSLTTLDVSSNTALTDLKCANNQLTSLDVSANTALTILDCNNNQLTYLNMKNGVTEGLVAFEASGNSLTCIETLDPDYATANWTLANGNIDDGVTFDVICGAEVRTHWYVATTGSDASGSGTLASPLANIQTAINATTNGDTVSVAAGTYVENLVFGGKNLSLFGADSSNTIIDGDSVSQVINLRNGEDSTTVIKNFTLRNGIGWENNGAAILMGGGAEFGPKLENLCITQNYDKAVTGSKTFSLKNSRIINNYDQGLSFGGSGSPKINNVIISGNQWSGVQCQNGSSPVFTNVIISNNVGELGGGVQCFDQASPTFTNCVISNNTATGSGGGIYSENSSLIIENSYINNNTSGHHGGGVYIQDGSDSRIINSYIENNTCPGYGGGLTFYRGNLELIGTVVSSNESTNDYGGGIYVDGGHVEIIESTLQSNTANGQGGGMFFHGSGYISRSRIVNNVSSVSGGGLVFCCGVETEIYNTTVAENSAGNDEGNGIFLNGCVGSVEIKNSILWNSGSEELRIEDDCIDEWNVVLEYSTIKGGEEDIVLNGNSLEWGDGNITADPLLEGGHTLGEGSPAMDAGNPHAFFHDHDGSRNDMGFTGGHGINVSRTEIDFGYVGIGNSRERQITIYSNLNYGGSTISDNAASFDDDQFGLNTNLPITIEQYSSQELDLNFSPTSVGTQNGTMTLEFGVSGDFTLTGTGVDLTDGVIEVPGEVPTIQEAIDASSDGDTVLVAAGTYVENLIIDKEIAVIGADREITIIDGDSSGSVVYFGSNAGMDTYFSGFTVQNGTGTYVSDYPSGYSGGGIFLYSGAQPFLKSIIVQNNTTNGSGAGIYVWDNAGGTALRLINSVVNNNSTIDEGHNHGGGIFNGSSNSIISGVEFSNNYASGTGGAISDGNSMLIYNCSFGNNVSGYEGDALSCAGTKIYNSTIVYNGTQDGECVIKANWNTKIESSIIWHNENPQIFNNNTPISVDYSIIYGGQSSFSDQGNLNWGTGNITSDPLFTGSGGFESQSPAINAGNPNGFYNDSDGSQNDIGYTGGNGIVVTPLALDFGNAGVGNNALTENIYIYNTGNDSIIFDSYSTTDNQFTVTAPSLPYTIQSLERKSLNIQYWPTSAGDHSSTLELSFSNLSNNNGTFSATAMAYDVPAGDIHVPADAPTIQAAIDIAPSGKTIVVAPGEYFENLIINKTDLIIKSSSGPVQTIINGGNQETVVTYDSGSNTLDGFTLTGGDFSGWVKGAAIEGGGGNDNYYTNLIITGNSSGQPIVYANPSSTFENVVIANNSITYQDGQQSALYSHGNSDGSLNFINVTIADNDGGAGISLGFITNEDHSVNFINSYVGANGSFPSINILGENNNSINITNSLIKNGQDGVVIDPNWSSTMSGSMNWLDGNIDAFPYFNDPDNGDYSLSSYSPMIGAGAMSVTIDGVTYDAPATDILGNARPNPAGTNPDIGAYESSESSADYNPNKYVATTGSNSNSGVITDPFLTIQYAIDQAVDNDIIHVAAGTYIENIDYSGKNIAIIGDDRETTIIDGNQAGTVVKIMGSPGSARLESMTITNGVGENSYFGGDDYAGGIFIDKSGTVLNDLYLYSNNSNGYAGGIYVNASGFTLSNSIIKDNIAAGDGGGIYVINSTDINIINNLFYGNGGSNGGGAISIQGTTADINNCTITNNQDNGLFLGIGSTVTMRETALYNNLFYQIKYRQNNGTADLDIEYSAIEDGQDSIYINGYGTLNWGSGNIDVEPMFVDTANGNYHLLASSQLINAGHPDSTDSDGTRADIGAYPYLNSYSGPTWYVQTDGSDTDGTGASATPFASIQSAINFATTTGDSVTVAAGTYYEHINTRDREIDIVGQGQDATIIDGSNSGFVFYVDSDIFLEGFTISGGGDESIGSGTGMQVWQANPIVQNCKFVNNMNGHLGLGACQDAKFVNTIFSYQNPNGPKWIPINSDNGTRGGDFINCLIDADGLSHAFTSNSYPSLFNCTVINYTEFAYNCGGSGVTPHIINSIFYPSPNYPNAPVADTSWINNNIFIDYCIFPESGTSFTNGDITVTYGDNNITGYPVFADTANGDYHLSDLSPCISAGTSSIIIDDITYTAPTTDLDGNPRPNPAGTVPDMGAYESDKGVDPNYAGPVWYVDGPAGLPYGNGGPGAPFTTIQAGIDASSSGDTVSVKAGTYVENINYNGKNIAVIGEDRETTIIDGNQNGSVVTMNSLSSSASISGFTIKNGIATRGGGMDVNGSYVHIRDIVLFENISSQQGGGINITSGGPILTNLLIVDNTTTNGGGIGAGIATYGSTALFDKVTVVDNNGQGVYSEYNDDINVINSNISGNWVQVVLGGDVSNISISYSNIENGLDSINTSENLVVTWGSGNIDVDPMFVDTANGNYHLLASSQLINAGHPDSTDSDGSRADIGAYPYLNSYSGDNGWHVSTSGNDTSGTGDPGDPFRSIQAGINFSSDADSVTVAAGTYVENINLNGKNIAVIGEDRETTIIDGNNLGPGVYITDVAQNLVLKNFTLTNGSEEEGGGIKIQNHSHCTIENVNIISNSSYGVGIWHWADVHMKNVLIADNSGPGIITYFGVELDLNNITITGNTSGLRFANNDQKLKIVNSIIYGNQNGSFVDDGSENDTLSVYYSNIEDGQSGLDTTTVIWGDNNIDIDPIFVDTANGNYHLLASSQLINAGHPDSTDSDGTRADIGAYPYLNSYSGPTWYVQTDGSDTDGTGASDNPFRSIQSGINFSSGADSVTAAAGTYVENINFRARNIKVVGADRETTIIDGSQDTTFNDGTGVVCFPISSGEGTTTVLKNFTIQNGTNFRGGGIMIAGDASPILENLIIKNNSAMVGGGIHSQNGSPVLINIDLDGNDALTDGLGKQGGGLCLASGTDASLINCTIRNNQGGNGGGIYSESSSISLINTTVNDNTAITEGGAMKITANSSIEISGSIVENNQSDSENSGLISSSSTVAITNSVFKDNGYHGIKISGDGPSESSISKTLVSGHSQGIASFNGSLAIDRCTVVNNGTLGMNFGFAGTRSITNSTIYNNDQNIEFIGSGGDAVLSISYSDIQGGQDSIATNENSTVTWGSGNIDVDPMFVDTANGNYNLLASSQLINAGHPDSTDSDGSRADIGAYPYLNSYDGYQWLVSDVGNDTSATGSPSDPFRSIQSAINFADDGDSVNVTEGLYTENINFRGRNIKVVGEDRETTIIDGDQNGSVVTFESGEDSTTVLDGFTLTNGYADYGGGINCFEYSSPTINNVIVTNNTATAAGGGLCFRDWSSPELTSIIIDNNTISSEGMGSALYTYQYSSPVFQDFQIINNYHTPSHDGSGEVMRLYDNCDVIFNDGTISNNSGSFFFYTDNKVEFSGVQFDGNLSDHYLISVSYWSSLDMYKTTFLNNTTPLGIGIDNESGINIKNSIMNERIYTPVEDGTVDTLTISYSLVLGSQDSVDMLQSAIINWGAGNIDVDPKFIDAENDNYNLLASSMLINAGHPDSTDSDGSRADIGAYPYLNSYSGPTWYITEAGNDTTATGSSEDPFRSIQSGINFSLDDDSVTVSEGTYFENINFRQKEIIVAGEDKNTTIIDAGQNGSGVYFDSGFNKPILKGFTIQNGTGEFSAHQPDPQPDDTKTGGGIYIANANPILSDLIIQNNTVGWYGAGISIWISEDDYPEGTPLDPVRISNVTFQDNQTQSDGGGLSAWGGDYTVNLDNCLFVNNDATQGGAIFSKGSYNQKYINQCIFIQNSGSGSVFKADHGDSTIFTNSIFYDNDGTEIFIERIDENTPEIYVGIQYSLTDFEFDSMYVGVASSLENLAGNINVDPMFVDTANGDYHLLADSRLIDAGHPDSTDADGTRADMGAYYYDQAGQPSRVLDLISTPGTSAIDLVWSANSAANAYNIYRSTDINTDFYSATPFTTTSDTSLNDSSVSAASTYYYRIGAVDSDGDEGILAFKEHGRIGSDSTSLYLQDAYLAHTLDSDHTGFSSYTIEAFVRFPHVPIDTMRFILIGGEAVVFLPSGDNGQLMMELDGVVYPGEIITDTSWHHIALTTDGSSTILWVDGNASVTANFGFAGFHPSLQFGNSTSFTTKSIFDEARLSNMVRYTAGFIPTSNFGLDSSTLGYWRFNEGSHDEVTPTVYDQSGNGLHLKIEYDESDVVAWQVDAPQRTDIENALVINEIMQNPAQVSDPLGEWVEIQNRWFTPVHLKDFILADDGTDNHTIITDVAIQSDSFGVFGLNADTSTNGGVDVDYELSGFSLGNSTDEVVLKLPDGTELDRVNYDNGVTFPDPSGASMELIAPHYNNSVGTNWTAATGLYGDGDLGSPGRRNDAFSGQIVMSDSTFNFGGIVSGEDVSDTLIISNMGVRRLMIDSITVSLPEYSLTPATAVLEIGDSIEILIAYAPNAAGVYNDHVRIYSDDPVNSLVTIPLYGVGISDVPDIIVMTADDDSLSAYGFPYTRIGSPRTFTFDVINIGAEDLEIDEIVISGDDNAFSVDVSSLNLELYDTTAVTVTFDPPTNGTYNATLSLTSNDPDEALYTIAFDGVASQYIIFYVPDEIATIQAALDSALAGDTIHVSSGTYGENLTLPSNDLVLRGAGADSTFLTGGDSSLVLTVDGGQSNSTIISDLTIQNGSGTNGGGMLIDNGSSPQLKNILFYDNSAAHGAALYIDGFSGPNLDHVTFVINSASVDGAGVSVAGGSTVSITNSIFWANTGSAIEVLSGSETTTYSIVEGGNGGTGNLDQNPLFAAPASADFHLQWGSPAIDSGDPASDSDPDGTNTDMGVYYYDQSYQPPNAPTGLAFTPAAADVALQWTANPEVDLTGYIIYKGLSTDQLDSLNVVSAPNNTYSDLNIDPAAVSYYQIAAVDTSQLLSERSDILTVSYPLIATDESQINFGSILFGTQGVQIMSVQNMGSMDLTIDSIYVEDQDHFIVSVGGRVLLPSSGTHIKDIRTLSLSAPENSGRSQDNNSPNLDNSIKGNDDIKRANLEEFSILPGDSLEITVSFSSPDTGSFTTNLFISSDDPVGNNLLSVELDARSVSPEISLTKTMSVVTFKGNDIPFNIAINNPGGWPLDYDVEVDADWFGFQWMDVNQPSGQVPGFTTDDLEINVANTSNIDPGALQGFVYFNTNTGGDPTIIDRTDTISVYMNLLADGSQITEGSATIPSGNASPIDVTDDQSQPIGLVLDFLNSQGGTVSVTRIDAHPPSDDTTPYTDPSSTITDPIFARKYFEISDDFSASFTVDVAFDYKIIPGILDPTKLRLAKRVLNAGVGETWNIIPSSQMNIDETNGYVIASNQTSFSQWAMLSNVGENTFIDVQAPVVSATTVTPTSPSILGDITVAALINDETGVDSASLYFQMGGASNYTDVLMTDDGSGSFSAIIPGANSTINGLSYYVNAKDVFGYSGTSDTGSIAIRFPDGALTSSMSGSAYQNGIPRDKWRLVSTPAQFDDAVITTVTGLPAPTPTTWNIFSYNGSNWVDAASMDLGSGYWIYQMVNEIQIFPGNSGVSSDLTGYTMTLQPGWNVIGSPYTFPINIALNQSTFYGPITYAIAGESWTAVETELAPWNGYAVYNRTADDQIILIDPLSDSGLINARMEVEYDWSVQLIVSSGIYSDRINHFGNIVGADHGLDIYDNPEIRSPGDYISLSFNIEDQPQTRFTTDYRKSDDENVQVWDIEIESKGLSHNAVLEWVIEREIEDQKIVQLVDLQSKTVIDIAQLSILELGKLNKHYTRKLKAVAGYPDDVNEKVSEILASIPDEFSLQPNYPNPFNPVTNIRFGLPEPRNIRLTVVNILGQEVLELSKGWQDLGFHTVQWNGLNQYGKNVSAGMYFAVLTDGKSLRVQKMLLLK